MKRKTLLGSLLVIAFAVFMTPGYARDILGSDSEVLGNQQWSITVDGDIVPNDNTYTIGTTSYSPGEICLSGVCKSSFGSIVSPWEDNGTTTTLTSAPTKFILTHSSGAASFTGFIAGTADVVLENGQIVDGGTNNQVILTDNSDSLDIEFTGNDITLRPSDGGIIFVTDAADATGTFNFQARGDTDDELTIDTISNVPTISTTGSSNLAILSSSGEITFGDDNLTTTGTLDSGATTVTSLIIGDDTLDVVVDDQLRFASNDEESTIEAYGFEAKNAVLQLSADEGDDAGDKFQIVATTGNALVFTSDTSVKDTHATILTLAKTGILTSTNAIKSVNDSSDTAVVRDILTLTHSSSGTPAAGLGTGISFLIDDLGGIEEQGSIDVVLTTETNGAEDADVVVKQNTAGAIAETLRLVAASSATVSDYMQYTANTTETNAVTNVLVLKTVTGTAANGYGMSISFQPEDATGAEEHASIDIVQTTAARATNDTDFVFTQDLNGTLTETVRFDVDAGTITILGATPLYFEGATADAYETILAVADAASSDKTVTLPSITASIALETVATVVITADTTATITVAPGTDQLFTYTIDTDDEDCTLTFSAGGTAGDIATIIFITDAAGSADEVMTFHGTLSDAEGTLTLANGASKRYTIRFISDGTIWNEISRTAVLG